MKNDVFIKKTLLLHYTIFDSKRKELLEFMLNQLIYFTKLIAYPFTVEFFSDPLKERENIKPGIIYILFHSVLLSAYLANHHIDANSMEWTWNVFIKKSLILLFFMLLTWGILAALLVIVPSAIGVQQENYAVIQLLGLLAGYSIVFNLLGAIFVKISLFSNVIFILNLLFSFLLINRYFLEETRSINFSMNVTLAVALLSIVTFSLIGTNPLTPAIFTS
jgi:hypothetical protein